MTELKILCRNVEQCVFAFLTPILKNCTIDADLEFVVYHKAGLNICIQYKI